MKIKELLNSIIKSGIKPEITRKIIADTVQHMIYNNSVESIDTIEGYVQGVEFPNKIIFGDVVISYKTSNKKIELKYPISSFYLV